MSVEVVEPIEGQSIDNLASQETPPKKRPNLLLLLIYIACVAVGSVGGPLIQRLYYTHGGTRKWLSSWLQSVGFFATIPPLTIFYFKRVSIKNITSDVFFMDFKLFISSCFIGVMIGLNNYMYSAGLSYLPVSTSSLLVSTQLAFTAIFAFLIVRQKFTFYSLNAVLVMTLGAVVLSLHTSSDRPPGVSQGKYLFGFFITLGAAAMWGLTSPLVELAYSKTSSPITFLIVLQVQVVMNAFASLVCTVGMLINNDFKIIPREARDFDLGKGKYYLILVSSALVWQLSTIGVMGVISCTSSLFNGILNSIMLPLTEVAGVIVFKEKFTGEKGLSLALCLWGFTSYFVGQYNKSRKANPIVALSTVNGVEATRITDLESPNHVAHGV